MNRLLKRPSRILLAVTIAVTSLRLLSAEDNDSSNQETLAQTLSQFCIDCHQDGSDSSVNISLMLEDLAFKKDSEGWTKVIQRLNDRSMPPEESEQPTQKTREELVHWINQSIQAAICDDGVTPGRPALRRLNRSEYANTVRDLLGIHVNAAHALPDERRGR